MDTLHNFIVFAILNVNSKYCFFSNCRKLRCY